MSERSTTYTVATVLGFRTADMAATNDFVSVRVSGDGAGPGMVVAERENRLAK
ncbi:hypothetical protein ACFQX6_61025 [Streptosporangium lutulentum]